ncbi:MULTISPECIES: SURF1 family protein [unclassified Roseitalea]|uniref:SURF1 family protein n=1 Tax=unclassified Roseitalea TaxID=2639107 RepID=UPI0027400628|nr:MULTISPECIES: SURF1 family protein [unclassified Roseitalea]
MSAPAQPERRRYPWLVVLFALPVLVALVMLGNWQVQRLAWKQDLLATIDARLDAPPVPAARIAELAADGGDIRYRPVEATGNFVHDREQHFFATHEGASGYYLYTPLEMEGGAVVLVNRGFVPFDLKEPETRPGSLTEGTVTVTGLARERLAAKPSFIVPDNDPEKNVYYWKDWALMVERAGYAPEEVLPFFIDAFEGEAGGDWPVGGVTRIDLPNNHLQYAITWYGLALALVVVLAAFVWRRMH